MAGLEDTLNTPAARVMDAGWRAAAYCLHPRVIGWSLLPLLIAGGGFLLLTWFAWEPMIGGMRGLLESWKLTEFLLTWADSRSADWLRSGVAIALVLALLVPVVMASSLLLVASLMTPALTQLVAERRFPLLERLQGGSFASGLMWSLGSTLIALALLLLSMPFWLIPPVVLVLPPLIWGWLSYRVFAYDVLAAHASPDERRTLLRQHRWPLLGIGIISGYLGAAPSLIFAFGALNLILAPLLLPIAIWLYMLVFAFAALWFAHFALGALEQLRRSTVQADTPPLQPGLPAP